jgi:hypothetical protein
MLQDQDIYQIVLTFIKENSKEIIVGVIVLLVGFIGKIPQKIWNRYCPKYDKSIESLFKKKHVPISEVIRVVSKVYPKSEDEVLKGILQGIYLGYFDEKI